MGFDVFEDIRKRADAPRDVPCGRENVSEVVLVSVSLLADLELIKWEARIQPGDRHAWKVSVDGTDFRIYESTPFNPKWYSHNFKGPGLRYEVAICISTSHIVWTCGPFPCGLFSYLSIFRLRMKKALLYDEMVVGDGGYNDDAVLLITDVEGEERKVLADIRARTAGNGEPTVQTISRSGPSLSSQISLHSICFHAVANVTQLMIENGYPLFDVDY